MDTATKAGIDPINFASKKVFYKAAEAAREFIGNKSPDKTVKPKLVSEADLKNIEEIVNQPEKREEMLNELRQAL